MATDLFARFPPSVTWMTPIVGTDQVCPRSGAPLPGRAASSSRYEVTCWPLPLIQVIESVNSQSGTAKGLVPQFALAAFKLPVSRQLATEPVVVGTLLVLTGSGSVTSRA